MVKELGNSYNNKRKYCPDVSQISIKDDSLPFSNQNNLRMNKDVKDHDLTNLYNAEPFLEHSLFDNEIDPINNEYEVGYSSSTSSLGSIKSNNNITTFSSNHNSLHSPSNSTVKSTSQEQKKKKSKIICPDPNIPLMQPSKRITRSATRSSKDATHVSQPNKHKQVSSDFSLGKSKQCAKVVPSVEVDDEKVTAVVVLSNEVEGRSSACLTCVTDTPSNNKLNKKNKISVKDNNYMISDINVNKRNNIAQTLSRLNTPPLESMANSKLQFNILTPYKSPFTYTNRTQTIEPSSPTKMTDNSIVNELFDKRNYSFLRESLCEKSRLLLRQVVQDSSQLRLDTIQNASNSTTELNTVSQLIPHLTSCLTSQQSFIVLLLGTPDEEKSCVVRAAVRLVNTKQNSLLPSTHSFKANIETPKRLSNRRQKKKIDSIKPNLQQSNTIPSNNEKWQLCSVVIPSFYQDEIGCLRWMCQQFFELYISKMSVNLSKLEQDTVLIEFINEAGIDWEMDVLESQLLPHSDNRNPSTARIPSRLNMTRQSLSECNEDLTKQIPISQDVKYEIASNTNLKGKMKRKNEFRLNTKCPSLKNLSFQQNIALVRILLQYLKQSKLIPILVIEELEILVFGTSQYRQALLYNLFNLIHFNNCCIGIVGCGTILNISSFFEKRIQSRFGLSRIFAHSALLPTTIRKALSSLFVFSHSECNAIFEKYYFNTQNSFTMSELKEEKKNIEQIIIPNFNKSVEAYFETSRFLELVESYAAVDNRAFENLLKNLCIQMISNLSSAHIRCGLQNIADYENYSCNALMTTPRISNKSSTPTQTLPYSKSIKSLEICSPLGNNRTPQKTRKRSGINLTPIELHESEETLESPLKKIKSDIGNLIETSRTVNIHESIIMEVDTQPAILHRTPTGKLNIQKELTTKTLSRFTFACIVDEHNKNGTNLCTLNWKIEFHDFMLVQLSLSELLILAAMTQLHRKRVLPKTLAEVIKEIKKIERTTFLHGGQHQTDNSTQGLEQLPQRFRIGYQRLLELGFLEKSALLQGGNEIANCYHIPIKYIFYERFWLLYATLRLPTYVERYLQSFSLKA